ncbi:hypothetical protein HZS_7190 [Henneguya salminicola]|nr:hypothetical protein HZS_7190 [Henneguya salminicola]
MIKTRWNISHFLIKIINDEVVRKNKIPIVLAFNSKGLEPEIDIKEMIDILHKEIKSISETTEKHLLSTNEKDKKFQNKNQEKINLESFQAIHATKEELLKFINKI